MLHKKSKFTGCQSFSIIKQSEAGTAVPELCRERSMSGAPFYKWGAKYGCLIDRMVNSA
ncbi:transposase [Pseudoalteromonas arctica]|uniref:transposase n=1 Tax=Pseudoalteromonas arctica TaxID=394751 RepID=UPI001C9D26C1|nr:transposase [Pseudoalteromonas arctica]